MQELKDKIASLSERLERLKEAIKLPEKKKQLIILTAKSESSDLWSDPEAARQTMQELSDLQFVFLRHKAT